MTKVTVSETLPAPVDDAWRVASDLKRFDEWLVMHDGWRGDIPEEISQGTELTSVVSVKGMRNRVGWLVEEFHAPDLIRLRGDGKGGTKVVLTFSIRPDGDGCRVEFTTDFSNPALPGPIGSAVGRALKCDVRKSIGRFVELV